MKHKKKSGRKKVTEASDDKFQDELIDLGLAPHIEAEAQRLEAEAQRRRTPPPKALTPAQERHAKMTEDFRRIGITTQDVLNFIESQKANEKDKKDAGN